MRWLSFLLVTLGVFLAVETRAAEITMDENYMGAPFGRSVLLRVQGEIKQGDLKKIRDAIGGVRFSKDLSLHVVFNSPGGSLVEGLEIGQYLNSLAYLPLVVTTDVATESSAPADCASACVFAYLGGTYRYLAEGSRLGVHQFYFRDETNLEVGLAVNHSQKLSGEIVSLLDETRVRPGFFKIIADTPPNEITWISAGDPWIQVSSATVELKAAISAAMASAGVFHPSVFLGLPFRSQATSFSHV